MTNSRAFVLGLRDVLHFAVAFGASFLTLWQAAGSPLTKAGLYALAPAAATVVFRQLFPNVGRLFATVTKAAPVDPTQRSLP